MDIYELHNKYSKTWDCTFGWGTNLTNNSLIKPLSIVMKLWKADNKYCVKLSDNPNKAIGFPKEVEYYKWQFNYNNNITNQQEIIY
jgi:nicotinate phosphoribosyltransferase